MKITAGNLDLRVDYRVPGKSYNETNGDIGNDGSDPSRSPYPFDSQDVKAGETWEVPAGAEVLRVVEYAPLQGRAPDVDGPST